MHELLEHRRKALFQELEVIDHVYSNESFDNKGAVNPHRWNAQLAREADNLIRIYYEHPENVNLFRNAIGLNNPDVRSASGIKLKALDQFRAQIAKELELSSPVGFDDDMIWIVNLSGVTFEPFV